MKEESFIKITLITLNFGQRIPISTYLFVGFLGRRGPRSGHAAVDDGQARVVGGDVGALGRRRRHRRGVAGRRRPVVGDAAQRPHHRLTVRRTHLRYPTTNTHTHKNEITKEN